MVFLIIQILLQNLLKHLDKPWYWGHFGLSSNPSITPDFIEKHLDEDWDWQALGLSINPNITSEFIERHLDKNWIWSCLSHNPNITTEFIEKYIDKSWDWEKFGLSNNNFNFNYFEYKNQKNKLFKNKFFNEIENWLWKPICNDKKNSINVKLGLKECKVRSV